MRAFVVEYKKENVCGEKKGNKRWILLMRNVGFLQEA
jgi:hypothetical protein